MNWYLVETMVGELHPVGGPDLRQAYVRHPQVRRSGETETVADLPVVRRAHFAATHYPIYIPIWKRTKNSKKLVHAGYMLLNT